MSFAITSGAHRLARGLAFIFLLLNVGGCFMDHYGERVTDLSEQVAREGGFKIGEVYVLKQPVFAMTYHHAAPPTSAHRHWYQGVPPTLNAYQQSPGAWPQVAGIFAAGTPFQVVRVINHQSIETTTLEVWAIIPGGLPQDAQWCITPMTSPESFGKNAHADFLELAPPPAKEFKSMR